MDSSTFFIIGANGQLGTALRLKYPDAKVADVGELDITDEASVQGFDWTDITHIFNAAAYTNVLGLSPPQDLPRLCSHHRLTEAKKVRFRDEVK